MKKMLLTLAAVMLGASVTLAAHVAPMAKASLKNQPTQTVQTVKQGLSNAKLTDLSEHHNVMKSATRGEAIVPEGEVMEMAEHGVGYEYNWLYGVVEYDNTIPSSLVYSDDGTTVYMQSPVTPLVVYDDYDNPQPHYQVGKLADGKITVDLNQKIYSDTWYNPAQEYFTGVFTLYYDDTEGEEGYWYELDESVTEITYTVAEDGTVTLDFDAQIDEESQLWDKVFGVYVREAGTEDTEWYGTGMVEVTYSKFDKEIVTMPEGLETEEWALVAVDLYGLANARLVNVGIDGDKIYINNLTDLKPEACFVGTIDGEKAYFETPQFMGADLTMYNCYMYMCGAEWGYDEEGEEMVFLLDGLGFAYDPEAKVLKGQEGQAMILNSMTDDISYISWFENVDFHFQNPEDTYAAPSNPTVSYFLNYDEEYELGFVDWDISNVNVNGAVISYDNLSFSFYIDNELFEFLPDEYGIDEPGTIFPVTFISPEGDIYGMGNVVEICFYTMVYEYVGLKLFYDADNGDVYETEVTNYNIETGEETVNVKDLQWNLVRQAESVVYTNLAGVRVSNPEKGGIYIKSVRYTDGTVSTRKVVR